MFSYIWPILLIVTENTFYQICAKGIPEAMNTYASMTITYVVASVFSFVMFFVTSKGHPNFKDFILTNWATVILAIVLIFLGFFLYKEQLSFSKIAGALICLVGLYFINK